METNYCRDFLMNYTEVERLKIKFCEGEKLNKAMNYIGLVKELIKKSMKFRMRFGGFMFDDGLKAVPRIVAMPYDTTAIEYAGPGGKRRISIISQQPREKDAASTRMMVMSVVDNNNGDGWSIVPFAMELEVIDGDENIFSRITGRYMALSKDFSKEEMAGVLKIDIHAALELIEALSCTNVEACKTTPRKLNKGAARAGALPFDSYHELMIKQSHKSQNGKATGFTHRSPREHLRRGHIRRLPSGNVWVNSCVVAAGAGSKIEKSYTVAPINHQERKAA